MTLREIRQAERIVRDYAERTERMCYDRGRGRRTTTILSIQWRGGGQTVAYSLDAVRAVRVVGYGHDADRIPTVQG